MKIIETILKNNNYPKAFYNRLLKNHSSTTNRTPSTQTSVVENVDLKRCRFPNIPTLSTKFQSLFKKESSISLVLYNTKTTNDLFSRVKDKESKVNRSGLIYEIPCKDCNAVYIGQTKQKLKTRISQHRSDCRFYSNTKSTALSEHHFEEEHIFNFDDVRILDMEPHHYKRNVSEMIHIIMNREKAINHRSDTNKLSDVYMNLIKTYQGQVATTTQSSSTTR